MDVQEILDERFYMIKFCFFTEKDCDILFEIIEGFEKGCQLI